MIATLFNLVDGDWHAARPSMKFGDARLPERFWQKVTIAESGCWEWQAGRTNEGYGRYSHNGRLWLPHRLLMALIHGEAAIEGMDILHACDNGRCCWPNHLSIGTRSDNMKDCVRKGRFVCNWNANRKKKQPIPQPAEGAR